MAESRAEPDASESERINQAVSGNRNALMPLLYAHYERLLQRIRKRLPDDLRGAVDAEDILQQVHIKAFRAINTLQKQDGASFGGWLTQIADNTLTDEIRKHRRGKRGCGKAAVHARADPGSAAGEALLDLVAGREHTPSRSAARHEAAQALQVAVAGLPPRQREAVSLVYLQGLSSNEAAQRMRTTESAVRSLVDRGRENLRAALGSMSKYLSRK
jgi:RNA polymerase sigma-70 factor (ECF subfamily)